MISARVLLIDDDPLYIGRTCAALRGSADVCVAREHDPDLLQTATNWKPDVVVVNALFAASDPLRVLDRVSQATTSSPGVICVASGAGALSHSQSTGEGFFAVVRRDADPAGLLPLLQHALSMRTIPDASLPSV